MSSCIQAVEHGGRMKSVLTVWVQLGQLNGRQKSIKKRLSWMEIERIFFLSNLITVSGNSF
jgi:hypothetical protein